MPLATIPIELVAHDKRLRQVSPEHVAALADSILDVGLLNPITVYRRDVFHDGATRPGYGVVAGMHRLEACASLGWVEIDANIVDLDDLHRQLAECDENLRGPSLSKAQLALFTRRRKEIYEALHPETKHGTNQHESSRKICDSSTGADRFSADTAAKTGRSERSVQLDAERGEKVAEDILADIAGTSLDKGTELDALKNLPPAEQRALADQAKAGQQVSARKEQKPVRLAPDPLNDFETKEKWMASIMAVWNRGSKEWREEFKDRIEGVVFDSGQAA